MADIVVTLMATLDGRPRLDREYQEVVHVPPGYTGTDTLMLFSHTVESVGWHALGESGLPTPLREAFIGNDAKLGRLEVLVALLERDWSETLPREVIDRFRELSLVDAREAFQRWGHEAEGSDQDD